jgi:hypothetical protein
LLTFIAILVRCLYIEHSPSFICFIRLSVNTAGAKLKQPSQPCNILLVLYDTLRNKAIATERSMYAIARGFGVLWDSQRL